MNSWVKWSQWTGEGMVNFGQMPVRDIAKYLQAFEVDFDEEAKFCPGCGQALDWSSKPRAKKIAGYVIGMPDTCTLNGNVYVLDDDGNEKMFSTEAKALGFLIAHGYTQRDIASGAVFIEEVKE